MPKPPDAEVDYTPLMDFLSDTRLCCIVNTDVKVFGHNACWDCYKILRRDVVYITMDWDIEVPAIVDFTPMRLKDE